MKKKSRSDFQNKLKKYGFGKGGVGQGEKDKRLRPR